MQGVTVILMRYVKSGSRMHLLDEEKCEGIAGETQVGVER
jgi:hypothetical protein